MDQTKVKCKECGWRGRDADILLADNPFNPELWDRISGCPKCFSINTIVHICDEDGCENQYTCGWPSPEGYRLTCGTHWDKDKK